MLRECTHVTKDLEETVVSAWMHFSIYVKIFIAYYATFLMSWLYSNLVESFFSKRRMAL